MKKGILILGGVIMLFASMGVNMNMEIKYEDELG